MLERFSVLHTEELDQFRAQIAQFLTPHKLSQVGGGRLQTDLSMVDLGPVSLVYGRNTGAELSVQLTEQVDYYDVNLAVAGSNLMLCGQDEVYLDEGTAAIISPAMLARMRLSDGYSQLHVRIERPALERHLEELLGRPIAGPIRFRSAMDLTSPGGRSWSQAVRLLVQDLEDPGGLAGEGSQSPWARFLMSGLLLAQPHNYSEQLRQGQSALRRPAPLKRALDLIEREPGGDLSLERLARESGLTPRSLQRQFREYVGSSPRSYVQALRLAGVHDDLRAAGAGTTVAEVALRWGFMHLGRFAAVYQDRYGEAPSATLKHS